MRSKFLYVACLTIALTGTSACNQTVTPEEEIRALVREAEIAAEDRQVGDLARLISAQYGDERGNSKDELVRMLRLQMIRNQVIYLMVRSGEIKIIDPDSATAVVHVAMAGGPLETFEDLARLGAELYRFDLDLVKESGKWRIIRARWGRAVDLEFASKKASPVEQPVRQPVRQINKTLSGHRTWI